MVNNEKDFINAIEANNKGKSNKKIKSSRERKRFLVIKIIAGSLFLLFFAVFIFKKDKDEQVDTSLGRYSPEVPDDIFELELPDQVVSDDAQTNLVGFKNPTVRETPKSTPPPKAPKPTPIVAVPYILPAPEYLETSAKILKSVEGSETLSVSSSSSSTTTARTQGSGPNTIPITDSQFFLNSDLVEPVSENTIQAGTIVSLVLKTGINSDHPGAIVAQVSRDVKSSFRPYRVLIPKGSEVMGSYATDVSYGQERVLVVWSRLTLTNGSILDLKGMQGVDMSGFSGYQARVDYHIPELLGALVMSTILTVATGEARNAVGLLGSQTLSDALTGAIDTSTSLASSVLDKAVNIPPTLKIEAGKRVNLLISRDIILEPYEE